MAGFAQAWAASVAGTGYIPMEHAELVDLLRGLTVRMVECLHDDPLDPRRGQEIGASLVAAHVTSAEGLGRTVEMINARLLPSLGLTGGDLPHRLAALVGAIATGYARALRDRTLDEQEAIRRAATFARQQAEIALRESEARFRYQATHDPLTDLPNRTLFMERLGASFADTGGPAGPSRRLGVCFVDLDGFKVVNDTLGHHTGDLLLMALADRLRRRMPDHLVARLGGDEFVILIEDTTCTDEVIKVADAALAMVAEPVSVEGHELTVSASVGIVESEVAATGPSEMLRAADVTLHWAKAAGKGRWAVFDPVRNEQDLARYALSAAMPAALERGEFFVEYQPLVSLDNGSMLGLEALARWRQPGTGVLLPGRFITLAEETGLIVRLGAQVLAEACHQARTWTDLCDRPPFVSVNLAVRQVHDPGLVDTVSTLLDRSGLPPERLQLEITEGSVIGADEAPVRALRRLADRGVRIAIDDFGTGYSNLAYLRKLPVCELKIAGSFVEGLLGPGGSTDQQILAALVSLAHTLGLTVTAEGVETAAQARQLHEIGCDAAQGWLFGPPTRHDQLVHLLATCGPRCTGRPDRRGAGAGAQELRQGREPAPGVRPPERPPTGRGR
jgi:diguanylate cyclase (GGDEF)-like protein